MSLTTFLLTQAASKAVEVVKGENFSATNFFENDYSRKVANVTKNISKVTETVADVAKNISKVTETVADVAKTVEKFSGEISSTAEVVSFQKEIKNLRKEGKITQDILDAILCENQNKLALAYREAIRAEAMGKPLKYLSEDEVDEALGFRKQITKAVTHKYLKKN